MRGLIRASLLNPWAVTVFALTIVVLGGLSLLSIPVDILPVFKNPAVQTLTYYSGMPPRDVERDITNRIERFTDMAAGLERQESRSILGTSIVRNYFSPDTDPGQALASVQSLASSELAQMPPGTLPPVVIPFDPTGTTPICLVAINGAKMGYGEKTLYDVGRYEVRNKIMEIHGAFSPVVFGGKIRAVQIYLDREKMMARNLSPIDVMRAVEDSNVFLPTGEAIVGDRDYFLNSNALFEKIPDMGEIPLRTESGNRAFLRDVATPTDDAMIQTTIVRVEGKKQAYVPVFRQTGASTLKVIEELKQRLPDIPPQLSKAGIALELIMDQSVYVKQSITSLAIEGVLGAVLCSLVILLFLGRWQMTMIAILTIPLSILSAIGILYALGQTINVMTLAGLSMAIGPMVDSAIISLENIDSHLEKGAKLRRAALDGPAEVALPELVANLSTLMVLAPLALMPGSGSYLFRPMTMAVAFAMATAYILSRTFVPARAAAWLREENKDDSGPSRNPIARAFARWQKMIEAGVAWYSRRLDWVLDHRRLVVLGSFGTLVVVVVVLGAPLRREFFPQVDSGAFEIYVRAPSGTRIEVTNERLVQVERFLRREIAEADLKLLVTEIGVTPDFSAAYTVNQAKMDAIVRVQLTEDRQKGAYEYTDHLRAAFEREPRFADLEIAFNAGGLILSALNQGQTAPINVRVTGKALEQSHEVAELIRRQVANLPGVVDARILQRLDYPEYIIEVDRAKAADLGLSQEEVMKNVIGAFNSSIQYNKKNFWIDRENGNNYFVGVQYPLESIESLEALFNVPITGVNQTAGDRRLAETNPIPHVSRPVLGGRPEQRTPVLLRSLISLRRTTIPTEVTHLNIMPTIDLNIGVSGRDLGHVAADIYKVVDRFGKLRKDQSAGSQQEGTTWDAYDPSSGNGRLLEGTRIVLSGEYARMQQTFRDLAIGLVLAVLLIYFLMVALDKSYIVPLANMTVVPLVLIGIMPMLYVTGTSINIQSLLGLIFTVGIKVSATVLLTDVAQELRKSEGLSPLEAIRRAGALRARPIVMTALAAFFAMIPAALALERGSEANAPLGRAILGGLLIGTPATLFVAPALYALMVHGPYTEPEDPEEPDEEGEEDRDGPERLSAG